MRFGRAGELTLQPLAAVCEWVRVLRRFARNDLLEHDDAGEMLAWGNTELSLRSDVRFAADRLRRTGAAPALVCSP